MSAVAHGARLYLIGHPRLEQVDGTRVEIPSRKGIALLAALAVSDRAERSRAWLQRLLWGSRELKQAQSSLRRELTNLKKVLDAAGLAILDAEQRVVRISLTDLWVDWREGSSAPAPEGDFLEGLDIAGEEEFEDWLREMRSRHDVRAVAPSTATTAVPATVAEDHQALLAIMPTIAPEGAPGACNLARAVTQSLTDLSSKVRWLPVILTDRLQFDTPDAKEAEQLSAQLKARYVVRSELLGRDDGPAVNFAMLEMPGHIIRWSETRSLGNLAAPEDMAKEVARAVNCLAATFDLSEQRHSDHRANHGDDLPSLAWRIRFHINQFTEADFGEAEKLIEQALVRNSAHPELLMLRANLALWQHWVNRSGSVTSAKLAPLIRAAMRADPLDARGPLFLGILDTWQRRGDSSLKLLSQACQLDPSSAQAFIHYGAAFYLNGKPELALEPLEHAQFLAPLDPKRFFILGEIGTALWMLERYEEALEKAIEIQQTHPGYVLGHVLQTASLFKLGRVEEAREARSALIDVKPWLHTAMLEWIPFIDSAWVDRLRAAVDFDEPHVRRLSAGRRG